MLKEMLPLAAAIFATLLTACASTPQPAATKAQVKIQYFGPRDDLNPVRNGINATTFYLQSSVDQHLLRQGLMYAIACNEAHTSCKHAITYDSMEVTITDLPIGEVKIQGNIDSQIGRRLTYDGSMGGLKMISQDAVADSIPVLDARTTHLPFSRTAAIGQKFTLPGIAGSHYDLTIEPAEEVFLPEK